MNVEEIIKLGNEQPETWGEMIGRIIGRYLAIGTEMAFCSAIFWIMKDVVL